MTEAWSVLEVSLPSDVYEQLHRRVARLDTSINDWIVTVIIEALEHPELLQRVGPESRG